MSDTLNQDLCLYELQRVICSIDIVFTMWVRKEWNRHPPRSWAVFSGVVVAVFVCHGQTLVMCPDVPLVLNQHL